MNESQAGRTLKLRIDAGSARRLERLLEEGVHPIAMLLLDLLLAERPDFLRHSTHCQPESGVGDWLFQRAHEYSSDNTWSSNRATV